MVHYCTALFVEFRIKLDRPPAFWIFSRSLIDRDIALYLLFSVDQIMLKAELRTDLLDGLDNFDKMYDNHGV